MKRLRVFQHGKCIFDEVVSVIDYVHPLRVHPSTGLGLNEYDTSRITRVRHDYGICEITEGTTFVVSEAQTQSPSKEEGED